MEWNWELFRDEYLTQTVATAAALVLLSLLKYGSRKLAKKYGEIWGKPKVRVRQIRYIIAVFLNITFAFIIAFVWGVKGKDFIIGISSVLAILGVAMVAQWSMLSNITAGIIMFFSAPYHVGNAIKIIDKDIPIEATIEKIGTFYTHIRTTDDELIVLPNNLFLQKVVGIKR